MNSFYERHKDSIRWHYRCFDRILLNGLIQPFQQPERVVGFFNTYRQLYPVTRQTLRGIADQFQYWLKNWSDGRRIPVLDAPPGRRDDFVDPYFSRAKPDSVAVILKAREPARIMTAIGDREANRWHLQIANRWVIQYNFYINDRQWGRMFVRICPYAKLPRSRRYQLLPHGYAICLIFLKLFERVYAPLAAGLLNPVAADQRLEPHKRSQLDRLYQRLTDDLDSLVRAVGLKAA
jgi:hypothetical protein